MDKIELRLDREQTDMIIYALGCARGNGGTAPAKAALAHLQVWIRARRERRWGDNYGAPYDRQISAPGHH